MARRSSLLAISILALQSSLAFAMEDDGDKPSSSAPPYRLSIDNSDQLSSSYQHATSSRPSDNEASSSFAERVTTPTLQHNTLIESGLRTDDHTRNARFMRMTDLAEEIRLNNFGLLLNLSHSSFLSENVSILFEALAQNTSISHINFSNCLFKPEHCDLIASMLHFNSTLESLDLMNSLMTADHISRLVPAFDKNTRLSYLNLRTKKSLPLNTIKNFYEGISTNRSLRVIVWTENDDLIPLLQSLAPTNPVVALHLGVMFREGINVAQDLGEAEKLFTLAASQNHPIGHFELGMLLAKQGDDSMAIAHFTTAANDYPAAAYELARYYRGEWGVSTFQQAPDYQQTLHWIQIAVAQGYPDAMYRLGRMYEHGRAVPPSDALAIRFFQKAADRRHADAQTALTGIYLEQAKQLRLIGDVEEAKKLEALADHYSVLAKKFSPAAQRFRIELQKQQAEISNPTN